MQFILDLEDAVAISEKPAARQCVVDAFTARPNSGTPSLCSSE
jgi:citrate lyase beta subunit